MTVMVRTLLEDFWGPTVVDCLSGFLGRKLLYEAVPRYVPSRGLEGSVGGGWLGFEGRDVSSYQFEVLVASSLLVVMVTGAAEGFEEVSRWVEGRVDAEVVVKPAFLRLRLIVRPSSSSEDVKPDSESERGGGVGSLFLMFDLPFAPRFLNETTGTSVAA